MSIDTKSTIRIVRIIVLGVVSIVALMVGCKKITEPSDVIKLKELELERMKDSLRLEGEIRELELEGELQEKLIEKGESSSSSLCYNC